jgi:hypothetical protein
MTSVEDAGVRAALQRALGHGAPYTDDDLARVTSLRVHGAADISALRECRDLQRLELFGSDITALDDIARLPALTELQVLGCPVADVAPLARATSLVELRIDFCFVEDLAPIVDLPQLRRGRFVGNPFAPASWHEIRPRWQRTSASGTGRRPVLEFGATRTWDTTRRMWDRGIRLCFAVLDGLRSILVRPGSCRTEGIEVDATEAPSARLAMAIDEGQATDELFDEIAGYWDRKGHPRPTDFASHRVFGDGADAAEWIADAPDTERADLARFIGHFPDAVFYKETEPVFAAVSALTECAYPAALAASRAILAGAVPDERPSFQLRSFTGSSPRAERLASIWYAQNLGIYSVSDRKKLLRDQARVFPIAEWIETGRSFLVSALSETDPTVYELAEQDLLDAVLDGRPLAAEMSRVFRSHAELLANVRAWKLPDGTVIEASLENTDDKLEG